MPKTAWEYKYAYLRADRIESELNKLGQKSWEAVGLTRANFLGFSGIILKRELEKPVCPD
jgi:hypothetical protein